ncbi:YhdH/YhfP family quinone oxidoreductase [Algiphilus sp. W345]|uniref:YhdH/YhfP family quinone oxidoreductase n=1 Tax=Banduia mediterranea TaxID=3075609 RepID=A0ABU2WGY5_9GAMM|nr:YhdH/YhfP family quinone oxidoreductase [Algiphilus sp. W345]MDT0497132.1 YhdH/YhfP family quinone oxidoreductase [Algiphilus sp. W345]
MESFQALRVHTVDKRAEARLETIALNDLSAGEVVVRVHWSGLNFKDALAVSGKGRIMRRSPCVAGIDLAGVVVESSSADVQAGAAVVVTGCNIGEQLDGGFAQYARVPAYAVVPLPDGLSLRESMAIGTAGFTAALALKRMLDNHQRPHMGPIAITGPTGGVGSIATDLFSRAGFKVAAITGKPEQAGDYLKALGASEIVDRKRLDFGSKPLETAVWGGAVDNLGGDALAYLTRTVKPWGNIALIGLASSPKLETTVIPFILRGASLLGIWSVEVPREWRLEIWKHLASDWKPRHLDRIVSRTIRLDEVTQAAEDLMGASMTGRYLVDLRD